MDAPRDSQNRAYLKERLRIRGSVIRPVIGRTVIASHFIQDRIRSTDLYDLASEDFDTALKSVRFDLIYEYRLPNNLARYYSEMGGEYDNSRLIHGMAEYIRDAYISKFRYADEHVAIAALHCVINVNMLALCFLSDYDINESWFHFTTETFGGFERDGGNRSITVLGIEMYLRPTNDFDTKFKSVGPSVEIHNENLTGFIDLCSNNDNPDLIVFGEKRDICVTLNGSEYISYQHTDTPVSRTHIPHYRLGIVRSRVLLYDLDMIMPSMMIKTVKAISDISSGKIANDHSLVAYIPRPYDILRLYQLTSHEYVSPFIGIISMIINNKVPQRQSLTSIIELAITMNTRILDILTSDCDTTQYRPSTYIKCVSNETPSWKRSFRAIFDM